MGYLVGRSAGSTWHLLCKPQRRSCQYCRAETPVATTMSADQWFDVLDQRQVGQSANKWVLQVHGVHRSLDGFWIQVSSTDDPFATIVLHLAPTTSVDEVLRALTQHERPADGQQAIID